MKTDKELLSAMWKSSFLEGVKVNGYNHAQTSTKKWIELNLRLPKIKYRGIRIDLTNECVEVVYVSNPGEWVVDPEFTADIFGE